MAGKTKGEGTHEVSRPYAGALAAATAAGLLAVPLVVSAPPTPASRRTARASR